MYRIFADDVCIYDDKTPLESYKVINPKLTMEDNSAGKLEFTITAISEGYPIIQRLSTHVSVFKDDEEIWSGRVITESKDFYNQRKLVCEGELAYLNDTTQPMHEYHIDSNTAVDEFLSALLANHNSKATSDMQFELGIVTVEDPNGYLYRYTNYESTLECIKEKLIDKLGGHIRVRKENGKRKLDYLADYVAVSGQTIEFGKNLVDFTSSWDLTELATVVLPLGNTLENSSIEALQEYLTVKDAAALDEDGITHDAGTIYVKSNQAISTYGWIETVVRWNDVSVASNLLTKAKKYLMDAQFETMILELSAVDLHNLNPEIEALKMLHEVQCISPPHGMNRLFPVTKMEIPLDKPEETVYTLGTHVQSAMSSKIREGNKEILTKIEDGSYSALTRAKKHAAEILNSRTRGYITIDEDATNEYSQELLISNTKDPKNATKLWVWNMGGLGHFPNGRYNQDGSSKLPNVAITMDGAIVADFITTGTLNAAKAKVINLDASNINTGTLNAALAKVINLNASNIVAGKISDKVGYNFWNLDTGEFRLSSSAKVVGGTNYSYTITSDIDIDWDKDYYYSKNGQYIQVNWDEVESNPVDGEPAVELNIAAAERYYGSKIYERSLIPVTKDLNQYINDNSGMTKQEIFNAITDNGANQGVFMLQNGNLYINASYINSGEINADLITTGGMSANRITSGEMSAERLSSGSDARLHNLTLGNDLLVVGKLKIKRKWKEISDSTKEYSGITGKYKLGDNNYYFLDGLLVKRD